jgi:hypothetical protein
MESENSNTPKLIYPRSKVNDVPCEVAINAWDIYCIHVENKHSMYDLSKLAAINHFCGEEQYNLL